MKTKIDRLPTTKISRRRTVPKSKPLPYFSRRMRELRRERGLSLYRLGKETEISDQALGKLERGSAPSLDTAARIARALAVPVAELIEPDGMGEQGHE